MFASMSRTALVLLPLVALLAAPVAGQVPTPSQAGQMLNSMPAETIRQRIQQSGLTPDQIRSRLAASGYPPNLLDAYIGTGTPTQGLGLITPGAQELAAIEALGFGPVTLPGQKLPVDTGMTKLQEARHAESLAVGNYVFGGDV